MKVFKQFIQQYQEGIEVHFIEGDPSIPHDFAEAMSMWNAPEIQAGPYGFSFERQTESHTG